MKVVQINCSASGSTGNIAKAIHRGLLEQGDESYIFYGIGQPTEKNMFRVGNDFDLHAHAVLSRNLGMQGYFSYFSTKKLIKQLRKIQPDIVHLHNLHGSYLNIPLLLKHLKETGVKVAVTLHDCWLYTGKCYHYFEAGCKRYLENCGNCPQLDMYPKSKYFDFTAKLLQDKKRLLSMDGLYVIAVSDWLHREAAVTFLSKHPIRTIKNGVAPLFKLPVEGNTRSDASFVILGVAPNWNSHKGIQDFVELSKYLKQDEKIVLVGHMPKNIVLPSNITSIEHTQDAEELAELYRNAAVYVSMSTEESFGMTIAEAMCCGTPAIVYNATACGEMVTPGANGYSVPAHDVEQVYRYIEKIRNGTPMNREKIAEDARERFSGERMVQEYLAFYKNIAE